MQTNSFICFLRKSQHKPRNSSARGFNDLLLSIRDVQRRRYASCHDHGARLLELLIAASRQVVVDPPRGVRVLVLVVRPGSNGAVALGQVAPVRVLAHETVPPARFRLGRNGVALLQLGARMLLAGRGVKAERLGLGVTGSFAAFVYGAVIPRSAVVRRLEIVGKTPVQAMACVQLAGGGGIVGVVRLEVRDRMVAFGQGVFVVLAARLLREPWQGREQLASHAVVELRFRLAFAGRRVGRVGRMRLVVRERVDCMAFCQGDCVMHAANILSFDRKRLLSGQAPVGVDLSL